MRVLSPQTGRSQGHLAAVASPAAAIPQSALVKKKRTPPISERPKQPECPLAASFFRALAVPVWHDDEKKMLLSAHTVREFICGVF